MPIRVGKANTALLCFVNLCLARRESHISGEVSRSGTMLERPSFRVLTHASATWIDAARIYYNGVPARPDVKDSHRREGTRRPFVLQNELKVLAAMVVLRPDFCWLKLTHSARKTHILEGLVATCLHDENFPLSRMYTCDITLASVQSNNGAGFLTLLKKYIPDSGMEVTEGACISYPHPSWTAEKIEKFGEREKEALQLLIAFRDEFLTTFIHNTILSVFGTPLPPEISVKGSDNFKYTTLGWEGVHKKLGAISKKMKPKRRPLFIDSRNPARAVNEWRTQAPISRSGTVYHYGKIFRRRVFLLRRIGAALNGYQRSTALLRKVQYLNVSPTRDYAFFSSSGPNFKPLPSPSFSPGSSCELFFDSPATSQCLAATSMRRSDEREWLEAFIDQFSAEYAVDTMSVFETVESQTASHPFRSPAVVGWKHEFLNSKYGSRYQNLETVPETTVSVQLSREVIQSLRQWKEST
ncbi:hypothetical protein DFH09DRAFT_1082081 [Mycena vulgaris]|nr:hypothetical protein DFH09DRAFT_1082081 [Mycena vulgaris]